MKKRKRIPYKVTGVYSSDTDIRLQGTLRHEIELAKKERIRLIEAIEETEEEKRDNESIEWDKKMKAEEEEEKRERQMERETNKVTWDYSPSEEDVIMVKLIRGEGDLNGY